MARKDFAVLMVTGILYPQTAGMGSIPKIALLFANTPFFYSEPTFPGRPIYLLRGKDRRDNKFVEKVKMARAATRAILLCSCTLRFVYN